MEDARAPEFDPNTVRRRARTKLSLFLKKLRHMRPPVRGAEIRVDEGGALDGDVDGNGIARVRMSMTDRTYRADTIEIFFPVLQENYEDMVKRLRIEWEKLAGLIFEQVYCGDSYNADGEPSKITKLVGPDSTDFT